MEKLRPVKIIVGYIITEAIYTDEEIKQYLDNINTFISHIDTMYIYNTTRSNMTKFYESLNKYAHIEIAECPDYGEAEIYQELINQAIKKEANYVTYIKPGYFYEEESFNELIKYVATANTTYLAVITPMPLLSCQNHERKAEEYRTIKGCRLLGALVNLDIYPKTKGIKTEYYQTTFDYDYCLQVRQLGFDVILAQNQVIRNQNYKVITRKLGFLTLSAYDRDLMDVYYETRNRYYLWKEYRHLDPSYVKIDKKLAKKEKQEIRTRDKHYKDKFEMMSKAKQDYKKNILGKYKERF